MRRMTVRKFEVIGRLRVLAAEMTTGIVLMLLVLRLVV
jgi:hypothetical protein